MMSRGAYCLIGGRTRLFATCLFVVGGLVLGGSVFLALPVLAEDAGADSSLSSSLGGAPISVVGIAQAPPKEEAPSFGADSDFPVSPAFVGEEIFSWDFESGLGGFAIDNAYGAGNGLWHLSTACEASGGTHSTPTALYYGQDGTCDYNAGNTQGAVLSPVIGLPGSGGGVELSFRYFLITEGVPSLWDMASVEVSMDGGPFYLVAHNNPLLGVYHLADPSGGWQTARIDLSAMPGFDMVVRFAFVTGDSVLNAYPGFYVDDVSVRTCRPPAPAMDPTPTSGATGVSTDQDVAWAGGGATPLFETGSLLLDGNEMTGWLQADDFILTSSVVIDSIRFKAFEYPSVWDGVCDYTIYTDNAGVPGTPIDSGSVALTRSLTGRDYAGALFEYQNSFTLPAPLALSAGTYWLGLHMSADCATVDGVYWTQANHAFGAYAQQSTSCTSGWAQAPASGHDYAFQLFGSSGVAEILVFTGHSDNNPGGEFENTIAAIQQHFTQINVTTTTTEDPAVLATELAGKDVLLMIEQETWNSASMAALGASWSTVLTNFVNAGGMVIVTDHWGWCYECGGAFLNSAGLMSVGAVSSADNFNATVAAAHPITQNVASPFVAMDGSNYYSSLSGTTLVTLEGTGEPMAAVNDIGLGHVVLLGWDYFSYNTDMARLIANAVSWSAGFCPDVSFDLYFGTTGTPPLVASDLTAASYDPGELTPSTTYYWQVVTKNCCGETPGPIWSFRTVEGAGGEHTPFSSADVPKPISDYTTTVSTLFVPTSGVIADIDLTLNISHTWVGDLRAWVQSPQGTVVSLFTYVGGSGDNFSGTTFDDEAAIPIGSGTAPFAGIFQPQGALALYDGQDAQGIWTLFVEDAAGGDVGTLNSWSVSVDFIGGAYPSPEVPLPITDYTTTTSRVYVAESLVITDVNVTLDITHTYCADLDVFLESPMGTIVELFTSVGGGGDNFTNTTLDDEAAIPITSGAAPFTGSYQPEGVLAVLDGENALGWWTLRVSDHAGLDVGTLNSWSVTIPGLVSPPNEKWVDFTFNGVENGSISNPFNTLIEGITAVDVAGILKIKGGATGEAYIMNKAMRLEAVGGLVRLGVAGLPFAKEAPAPLTGAEDGQESPKEGQITGIIKAFRETIKDALEKLMK